jgi:16S rRNA processing protein RimM
VAADWRDMIVVGRVARTQGNRGEVIVNPETDFPEDRFRAGAEFAAGRERPVRIVRVAAVRFHQGRPVLALDGIRSIGEAEELAGLELRIPPEAIHALPDDTYYQHDLVGCRVETVDGEPVGVVRSVGGEAARGLVVVGPRGEVLVPFARAICVGIHVADRRIVIDPPEGLLEVNG